MTVRAKEAGSPRQREISWARDYASDRIRELIEDRECLTTAEQHLAIVFNARQAVRAGRWLLRHGYGPQEGRL